MGRNQHCRAIFLYDFYFMTFNVVLFFLFFLFLFFWGGGSGVQAGLESPALCILCLEG